MVVCQLCETFSLKITELISYTMFFAVNEALSKEHFLLGKKLEAVKTLYLCIKNDDMENNVLN